MSYRKGIVAQFGVITTIVNLDSAVAKEESYKQVCVAGHPPTPVRQSLNCEHCGPIQRSDLKKAQVVGDQYVLIEADEIEQIKAEVVASTKKVIQLTPHRTEDVRACTLPSGSSYCLTPSDTYAKPTYSLLVDTLKRHPEITLLGLWTPTSRPNLYEAKLYGDSLVLEQRARPEDVQVPSLEITEIPEVNQKQIDQLLAGMVQDFNPSTYADTYRDRVADLLASKDAVTGVVLEKVAGAAKPAATAAVDLTALLQQQMEALAS